MDKIYQVLRNLFQSSFSGSGSAVIDNTTNYKTLRDYVALEALEDTVVTTLRIDGMVDIDDDTPSDYYDGKTILAQQVVYGNIREVELASGAVRLHKKL